MQGDHTCSSASHSLAFNTQFSGTARALLSMKLVPIASRTGLRSASRSTTHHRFHSSVTPHAGSPMLASGSR